MKIHLKCGKPIGEPMVFAVRPVCQGEIVIDEPLTGDMAQRMMDQFYMEHEHAEEEGPDDKDPEELPTNGMQIVQDPPTPFDLVEGPEGAEAHG